MVADYRGIAALWLAFSVLWAAGPAYSDRVRVGELELDVAAPWQQVTQDESGPAGNIVLRQSGLGAAVDVYLPMRPVRLKVDADTFYQQLERSWRSHYGEQAVLGWQEVAGVRWRSCRHASQDGQSTLFQLVTVRGGEAYQMLVVAPEGTAELPDRVLSLLRQGHWDGSQSAAAVGPAWHLLRQVVVLPDQGQWSRIARDEAPRLGPDGEVTGLGLHSLGNGLDWFLEGDYEGSSGTAQRGEYRVHWQLVWQPLPEVWHAGEALTMNLAFSEGVAAGAGFGVRYELHAVCAPPDVLNSWLDALAQPGGTAMNRLAEMTGGCSNRSGDDAPDLPVVMVDGRDGGTGEVVAREARILLPASWTGGTPAGVSPVERRLLLVMFPLVSESGTAPGDALLSRAAVVFVFGPDS